MNEKKLKEYDNEAKKLDEIIKNESSQIEKVKKEANEKLKLQHEQIANMTLESDLKDV